MIQAVVASLNVKARSAILHGAHIGLSAILLGAVLGIHDLENAHRAANSSDPEADKDTYDVVHERKAVVTPRATAFRSGRTALRGVGP